MDSKKDNNVVKVDIFIQGRDGFCVPFSAVCERLEEKKRKLIRKKQITKQRLSILNKMIRNSRYEQVRCGLTVLLYLISVGCVFYPNRQVQKTGGVIGVTTAAVSCMAVFSLNRHYKKLQKQDAYWKKQEQVLERS